MVMQAPSDVLLPRLEKVKETGPGQWIACCPAHDDRSPSLSITEKQDGMILLHCFAGCPSADVAAAVGLTLADLYPKGAQRGRLDGAFNRQRRHRSYSPSQVLSALAPEIWILADLASDMREGVILSDEDFARLNLCANRVIKAAAEVRL